MGPRVKPEDDGGWGGLRGKSSDSEGVAATLRLLPMTLPGLRHFRP